MADITVQPSALCIVGVSVGAGETRQGLRDSHASERQPEGDRGGGWGRGEAEKDGEIRRGAGNWK